MASMKTVHYIVKEKIEKIFKDTDGFDLETEIGKR